MDFNQKHTPIILLVIIFAVLVFVFINFEMEDSVDRIYLTIATFLYATVSGFFIARQGARYSSIRKAIANFDGNMSALYRISENLGNAMQIQVGDVLLKHYRKILKTNEWDYHLTHKSAMLAKLGEILRNEVGDKGLKTLGAHTVNRYTTIGVNAQITRKYLVALREERIPTFQWVLMYVLAGILLVSISSVPSVGELLPSAVKAASVVAIGSVLLILRRLETLALFEGTIGEHTAEDIISIIKGKR